MDSLGEYKPASSGYCPEPSVQEQTKNELPATVMKRYRTLCRLAKRLSTVKPENLVPTIAEEMSAVLRFDRLDIFLNPEGSRQTFPHEGCCGRSVGEPGQSPIVPDLRESNYDENVKGQTSVPLISRGSVLGYLVVVRYDESEFLENEIEFLAEVACQVCVLVDNSLAHRHIAHLTEKLTPEIISFEDEIPNGSDFEDIVGKSAALRALLRQVKTVAPTDSTVLIYGETGTGKELVARALHNLSSRRTKPFVKLNCAAIPTGLLESELFGHERGAFTSAIAQRIGRFELANHGTIFLDEIGEIPLELQPKLLRVLQEREFERLGSSHTLRTDARLVAATNRDLSSLVQEQKFRSDLFYRLNVFPVQVPPLRARREDIPLLVHHFVRRFSERMNKNIGSIPKRGMEALVSYSWPGNIRELENVIERAVILSPGPELLVSVEQLKRVAPGQGGWKPQTLEEAEREHILATLKQTQWVLAGPGGAAVRLGLHRSTLQFRMKKLGIVRPGL